jgi:hypothetical protein
MLLRATIQCVGKEMLFELEWNVLLITAKADVPVLTRHYVVETHAGVEV